MATTPLHCPGWERFKDLNAFVCKCNRCGAKKEIFSDEFDKPHTCRACGENIDFSTCDYEAGGNTRTPR
jgi:hypothetical protein